MYLQSHDCCRFATIWQNSRVQVQMVAQNIQQWNSGENKYGQNHIIKELKSLILYLYGGR